MIMKTMTWAALRWAIKINRNCSNVFAEFFIRSIIFNCSPLAFVPSDWAGISASKGGNLLYFRSSTESWTPQTSPKHYHELVFAILFRVWQSYGCNIPRWLSCVKWNFHDCFVMKRLPTSYRGPTLSRESRQKVLLRLRHSKLSLYQNGRRKVRNSKRSIQTWHR